MPSAVLGGRVVDLEARLFSDENSLSCTSGVWHLKTFLFDCICHFDCMFGDVAVVRRVDVLLFFFSIIPELYSILSIL